VLQTWISLTLTRKVTPENKSKWIKRVHALNGRSSVDQMRGGLEFNQHGSLSDDEDKMFWLKVASS